MCELGIHIAVTIVLANVRHADLIRNSTKCGAVSGPGAKPPQGFKQPRIKSPRNLTPAKNLQKVTRSIPIFDHIGFITSEPSSALSVH